MKRFSGLVVLTVVAALVATPAWADSVHIGGTENITNEGGAGGNATATSSAAAAASAQQQQSNTNVFVPTNVNSNVQGQHQGQIQGQQQGQAQGQRQSQNNKQTIAPSQTVNIAGDEIPAQAPAIFAPNLTSSPEACMGSVSAGGGAGFGGTSFGITFGTTWTNDQCQDRMNARTLGSLGQNQAALEYLAATNPKIAEALKKAGAKMASVDITVPALTLNTPLGQAPVVQPGGVKVEKRDEVAKAEGPTCGDGKPAKLRPSGFYSCYGWDR